MHIFSLQQYHFHARTCEARLEKSPQEPTGGAHRSPQEGKGTKKVKTHPFSARPDPFNLIFGWRGRSMTTVETRGKDHIVRGFLDSKF